MNKNVDTFRNVISSIMDRSTLEWVYLPSDYKWSLDSSCLTLKSDDIPLEPEDDSDADVPLLAIENSLIRAVSVQELQDIVLSARQLNPDIDLNGLFQSFLFYYNNDSFMS